MKFLHIQNVSTPKISTWQTFLHGQCPWGPRQISSKVTSIGSKKKSPKLDEIYMQYGFDGKSGKPAKLFFWQLWKCCSANFTANIYFAMQCIPSSVAATKTTISPAQEKVLCAPAILYKIWRGDLVDQNYSRIGERQCNLLQTLI